MRWQVGAQKNTVHLMIPIDPQISAPKYVYIPLSPAVSQLLSAYQLDLSAHVDGRREIQKGGGKLTTHFWAQDSRSRMDTSHISGHAKLSPFERFLL